MTELAGLAYVEGVSSKRQAGLFLTAGSIALATTYLASRGNHSRIHSEVIAPLAFCSETVTTLTGVGLMATGNNENISRGLRAIGKVGLGLIALTFISVALTDIHFVNHFRSGKGFSRQDLVSLGSNFFEDFKRHMIDGTKIVFAAAK